MYLDRQAIDNSGGTLRDRERRLQYKNLRLTNRVVRVK